MKRTIVFMLIALCAAFASASAIGGDGVYAGVTDNALKPTYSSHYDGLNYSLFSNPASLAERHLRIQLPDVAFSSYSFSESVKDRGVAEALSRITRFQADRNDIIAYALGVVMAAGAGYNDVLRTDVGTGVQVGNMGFGLNVILDVRSMPHIDSDGNLEDPGSVAGNGFVPRLDLAFTFGYGYRLLDTGLLTLDVGAAVRFSQRIYMLQISTDQVSELIKGSRAFENLPARGGFAVPVDLGVTVGVAGGHIKFNLAADNLNGIYYMRNYANGKNALIFRGGTDPYKFYTPFSVNASVVMKGTLISVNPELWFGVNGINLYLKDMKTMASPKRELMRYLDLGLGVNIFSSVSLRAWFRDGYPGIGAAFDIFGNDVELTYSFHEAGEAYGERPVDCLTLRVRLGFDTKK